MAQGSASDVPHGIFLVGELRGGATVEGRERPGGEGKYPSRYRLSLAVGADRIGVEYRDEQAARDAVEQAYGGPAEVGDTITLPVYARAGARGGADAFIFWSGRGERSEPDLSW